MARRSSLSTYAPRAGLPPERPQRLDGDPELERRPGREVRARVPGRTGACREVPDVDRARAGEGAHERDDSPSQCAVGVRERPAGPGARRQAEHVAHRGAALASAERRRRHPDGDVATRQRHAEVEPSPAQVVRQRRPCRRPGSTSSFVPRGALPATCPKETSYGAGALSTGGGNGGVAEITSRPPPRRRPRPRSRRAGPGNRDA